MTSWGRLLLLPPKPGVRQIPGGREVVELLVLVLVDVLVLVEVDVEQLVTQGAGASRWPSRRP